MARTNWRSRAHDRLTRMLPDAGACVQTPALHDLELALRNLLFVQHRNLLIINGGDGTIHHTLNAAIRVTRAAADATVEACPLPTFLFVNGGGMNMVARTLKTRGQPAKTLQRFLDASRDAPLGELPTQTLPLLGIREGAATAERYGFIWGSELVMNALTMYERYGQGYPGLARFLWEAMIGLPMKTEEWAQFGHLLDPPPTPLEVAGRVYPTYTSAVATTVPMMLLKGLVGTFRKPAKSGTLNVLAVIETRKARVLGSIPMLLLGGRYPGVEYHKDVAGLRVRGPYTIDGERVTRPGDDPGGGTRAAISVVGTDVVVRGVSLD